MRIFLTTLLLVLSAHTLVQAQDSVLNQRIRGTLIDSNSFEPVIDAVVYLRPDVRAFPDFDGNFEIAPSGCGDDSLTIGAPDYKSRKAKALSNYGQHILIKLVRADFIAPPTLMRSEPTDTIYHKTGEIARIKYQLGDEISFYRSGQMSSKTVSGSRWRWSKNGKLQYQSIPKNDLQRRITLWHSNGKMKAQGTMELLRDEKTNADKWINSGDWIFWNKKGRELYRGGQLIRM